MTHPEIESFYKCARCNADVRRDSNGVLHVGIFFNVVIEGEQKAIQYCCMCTQEMLSYMAEASKNRGALAMNPTHQIQVQDIPVDKRIQTFFHCTKCLKQMPENESRETWGRFQIGMTPEGFQVWCARHQHNIIHIHFEGQTHPASMQ